MGDDTPAALGALRVDEAKLKGHVDEVVRSSVEETLNGLLDAEADSICRAQRYEHWPDRVDTRAGHYQRKLETKAGQVILKVPKLRRLPFETAIIERYRRRESSVEEALVEMYLAGVSVRRVEDITEALWGTRVSSGTVSRLNQRIYRHIEAWRNRKIEGEFPYLYLDGVILKRSWAGEVRNVSVLVAIGIGTDGFRQILGVAEGEKEDLEGWRGFLRHLKDRGLRGVRLIVSDACRGLVEAASEVLPKTDWQRCVVHFYRNVFSHVPNSKVAEVARMLKAIHAQEDRKAATAKAREVAARLKAMKLKSAAELVEQKVRETLTYYAYPSTHWRQLRTNNPLERIIREIRRRTRVVGAFSGRALGIDAGRGETETHRFNQMGQATLLRDGHAVESCGAGGGLMQLLLPGLRPVRLTCGFAAAQEELREKRRMIRGPDRATAGRKSERFVALPARAFAPLHPRPTLRRLDARQRFAVGSRPGHTPEPVF